MGAGRWKQDGKMKLVGVGGGHRENGNNRLGKVDAYRDIK